IMAEMHSGAVELAHVSAIVSIFSVSLNALLIGAIWYRSPEKLRHRVVACLFVLIDIFFSIVHVINVPIFVSIRGTFLFYPARLIGSTSSNWLLFASFLYLCVSTMFIVCKRFFYRYAQICSPSLYSFISNPFFLALLLLSTAIACAAITLIGMSIFLPQESFTAGICRDFNDILVADFCDKVFLGGSVKETLENTQAMHMLLVFLAGVAAAMIVILYCGRRIDRKVSLIKLSHFSDNLHRKTLKILIVQTVIPFVFVYLPIVIHIISMITYVNTLPITFILSYFLVIFPLANAASHLYFIKDYRAFVFGIIFRPLIKVAGK
ncbi:hypothetical protein PMAYCL1PPCAC_12923, partial [Pristionchus mayeri]